MFNPVLFIVSYSIVKRQFNKYIQDYLSTALCILFYIQEYFKGFIGNWNSVQLQLFSLK